MSSLNDFLIKLDKYKVISIIGLAKNVSKTTTLNHIIKHTHNKIVLGLTSIGRDGEKYDVITDLPKPRIFIEKGTYVATARESLKNSEINLEILKHTSISTPMGDILVGKAISSGLIELAGPSTIHQLTKICDELKELGCELILIDGAFDRRTFATPLISEATILSTGASVSDNIKKVVELTLNTVELLTLERENDDDILKITKKIVQNKNVGIINQNKSYKTLDVMTALDAGQYLANILDEQSKYIVIKGAVTDKFLIDIMEFTNFHKNLTLLVEDGTKLFLSSKIFNKFRKKGGSIKVVHLINIIAITINPTSPDGYNFNKNNFLSLLKQNIELPIYDLGPCG